MERHKKKNFVSKMFAGLLALVMLSGLLGIPALADDTTTGAGQPFKITDAYDLAFGDDIVPEYDYYSPYVPYLTYNGKNVEGYSILFGLANTSNNKEIIHAYCTDIPVDAESTNYKRLNLIDSTYAATHADKLRAIVLGSYPYLKLDQLIQNSGITGLSIWEAITGTQLAIWKTAHDDTVQITDFLGKTTAQSYSNQDSGHTDEAKAEYNAYNSGTDEYKAGVKSRIEALYNYLMKLEPVQASSTVISTASFTDRATAPTVTANGDGTYNVTVSATVTIPGNSNVKLTAFLTDAFTTDTNGNKQYTYYTTRENISSGTYTLTIENVPASLANGSVTLSLDGTQTVSEDVFLLDAEGIRGVSQSMIAPLSGTMPVHAEVKAEPDRVINIEKYEQVSTDLQNNKAHPLEGISFEVYYVCSVDEFRNGTVKVGESTADGIKPTSADITKYATSKNLVGTITTDASGKGSLNLSTADGLYLVVELPDDRVTGSNPFFVCLPDYSRLDENGNPAYTITAYAKNEVAYGEIEIKKVDAANNTPLSGAKFKLYRVAQQDELNDSEDILVSANTTMKMKPVSFYDNASRTGNTVNEITTDSKGTAHIYGLVCGEHYQYYLVETEAPAGYNKLPYAVKVDKEVVSVTHEITVENSTGTELPSTGGIGTGVFTVAGLLCMAGATVVLCRKKEH